jgi:hypothetical protein
MGWLTAGRSMKPPLGDVLAGCMAAELPGIISGPLLPGIMAPTQTAPPAQTVPVSVHAAQPIAGEWQNARHPPSTKQGSVGITCHASPAVQQQEGGTAAACTYMGAQLICDTGPTAYTCMG